MKLREIYSFEYRDSGCSYVPATSGSECVRLFAGHQIRSVVDERMACVVDHDWFGNIMNRMNWMNGMNGVSWMDVMHRMASVSRMDVVDLMNRAWMMRCRDISHLRSQVLAVQIGIMVYHRS